MDGIHPVQQLPADPHPIPPQPGAVLVLERWNSWVRVLEPVSGTTHWVDLSDTGFETVSSCTGTS
jgi:hypothetical protein